MKALLNLISISMLTTALIPSNNYLANNPIGNNNLINHELSPNAKKIVGLNDDINKAIAVDDSIWVGAGIPLAFQGGVFKSSDDTHFSQIASLDVDNQLNNIVNFKTGEFYIAYGGHEYISDDGVTFRINKVNNLFIDHMAINSREIVYASWRNSFSWSVDGIHFTESLQLPNFKTIDNIIVAPNDTIYLLVSDGSTHTLFRSTDHGWNFKRISHLGNVRDIAIDQNNTIYLSNGNLLKSTDDCKTFETILERDNKDINDIDLAVDGSLYVLTVHDVWKLNSDNSLTNIWNFSQMLTFLTVAKNGLLWVGTFNQGLYKIWFD